MDKAAERKKDSKSCGDTDIGIHKYGPGNVRAQLPSMWDHAPKEVVGLPLDRLLTNCYSKDCSDKKADLMEEVINGGPPFSNVSHPKVIL
jgi:hypothetical protein